MYLNEHIYNGNVGRDAVIRDAGSGKVLSFSVANTSPYDDSTTWYNVSLWGDQGEKLAPRVLKGVEVIIVGENKLRKYTTKAGEERVEATTRARSVQLVGKKGEIVATVNGDMETAEEDDDELPF